MAGPLIGITAYRNREPSGHNQFSIGENYIQSLIQAGACPFMIPSGLKDADVNHLIACLDGLLLSGGGDIHPRYYDASENPAVNEVDLDRDHLEFNLLERCLALKLPLFGICRGLQVINVGLGGTLYEDIQEQKPSAIQHEFSTGWSRDYLAHEVNLAPESWLAHLFGETHIQVNSLHHQGIRRLSNKLEALGRAPDGLIEALQINDYPYGFAVQWHPEEMQSDPKMQALFRSFVEAAMAYRRQ